VPINLTDQAKQIQERMGKENRQKKERNRKKKKRNRTEGKMGSQLFFRLACVVPLAITRLERNVFSGLFPGLTHL